MCEVTIERSECVRCSICRCLVCIAFDAHFSLVLPADSYPAAAAGLGSLVRPRSASAWAPTTASQSRNRPVRRTPAWIDYLDSTRARHSASWRTVGVTARHAEGNSTQLALGTVTGRRGTCVGQADYLPDRGRHCTAMAAIRHRRRTSSRGRTRAMCRATVTAADRQRTNRSGMRQPTSVRRTNQ
jgi:hypothetical protein